MAEAKAGVHPSLPPCSLQIPQHLEVSTCPWIVTGESTDSKKAGRHRHGSIIPGLLGPLLVLDSYSSSAQGTYVCVCAQMHMCVQKLKDKLWCHSWDTIYFFGFFDTVWQTPGTCHVSYPGWRLGPRNLSASQPSDYRYTPPCLAIFPFFRNRGYGESSSGPRSNSQFAESQIWLERSRGNPEKEKSGYKGRSTLWPEKRFQL